MVNGFSGFLDDRLSHVGGFGGLHDEFLKVEFLVIRAAEPLEARGFAPTQTSNPSGESAFPRPLRKGWLAVSGRALRIRCDARGLFGLLALRFGCCTGAWCVEMHFGHVDVVFDWQAIEVGDRVIGIKLDAVK